MGVVVLVSSPALAQGDSKLYRPVPLQCHENDDKEVVYSTDHPFRYRTPHGALIIPSGIEPLMEH